VQDLLALLGGVLHPLLLRSGRTAARASRERHGWLTSIGVNIAYVAVIGTDVIIHATAADREKLGATGNLVRRLLLLLLLQELLLL